MMRLFPLLLCILFLFTGCTSSKLPLTENTPSATLPPSSVPFAAPIGDAALEYKKSAVLSLPSHNGIGLSTVENEISFSLVRPVAETLIRSLIAHQGNKEAASLGGDVRLALYGANPVEISRDVATINLSASALQLDRERLFIACQAMTNTLTALDSINYVNVLVVDKAIGLDIANSLPMGLLTGNSASDLGAVYDQLLSRRITTDNSASSSPLSANVALYFPLQDSEGLVCEARSVTFENQQIGDMITVLLRELAQGPADSSIPSPQLPLLADLLTSTPTLRENSPSGGMIISLDFAHNLDDMLDAYGISRTQCTASLCYTLSSFFPNVSGIKLSISGTPVDSMLLSENETAQEAYVFSRSDFSNLLYDFCTLYLPQNSSQKLVSFKRAIPYYQCSNPRILLCELAKKPDSKEAQADLIPIMPEKAITDTVLLGFSLSDSTLLVNFAPAFAAEAVANLSAEQERLMVYALVNTLCEDPRIRNVCFFQSGLQFDGFSGEIYWRGLFYPLPT